MNIKLGMAATIFLTALGVMGALQLYAGGAALTQAAASGEILRPDANAALSGGFAAGQTGTGKPAADTGLAETGGSAGCRHARPVDAAPGTTVTREMTSGGVTRTYRIHVSANTDGSPAPMVLLFHGRGGSGQWVEDYSGMLPVSDHAGFLLVSPDGVAVDSVTGWGAGASPANWPVDDVQFGRDLIAQVKADFCIDATRVYAVGHSNGAFMAARLGCALPGEIAAIAPVAGISVPAEGCAGSLPVIAVHGTADDVVPYAGGKVRDTFDYPGAQHEISAWAKNDGCSPTPTYERLAAKLNVEEFANCTQPVRMILNEGAGHGWPTPAEAPAADLIWSFLSQFHT